MSDILAQQLATLPIGPGVYLFKNAQGDILYVGKAKMLRSRAQSYFRERAALDPAKEQMMPRIANIETIVTDNENEALILEANLIRRHRPPYNVVLTDDKYYLFIKITTTEDWPRVFPVRRLKNDGNRYFGPYSSARAVRQTLKLLRRIFPYRAEKDSPNDVIFPHPLFSQGQGPRSSAGANFGGSEEGDRRTEGEEAPTERAVRKAEGVGPAHQEYQDNIRNIIRFLQGDRQSILNTLHAGMRQAAADKKYERAAIWRDQYQAIERLEGYQKVFLPRPESFDVISIVTEASRSAANVLAVRQGKLLDKNTFLLKHQRQTNSADILRQFLLQYYRDAQDIPPTILTPESLPDTDTLAAWINKEHPPVIATPLRGKKRQLMSMGQMNAQQLLALETAAFAQDARLKRALEELSKVLHIDTEASSLRHPWTPGSGPRGGFGRQARGDSPLARIETYDISNIQGKQATGSMVVFSEGEPDKNQYRKFRIKVGDTPNDYAMLQEVLTRRFNQRHAEWKTPSLIFIDGGKGQLNAARKILKYMGLDIPLASIAKREEILFFYDAEAKIKEVRLPYDSDALYLIQRMRDEAHRFGVSYHRLLRSKQSQRSLLDEIPGIGPTTKKRLLNHFGSLKNIRAASDEELIKLIGTAKTVSLHNFL